MANVLNLLPNAVGQAQPNVMQAMVSLRQQAPLSFAEPMYLTIPLWNPDLNFTVWDWPACHGSNLPQQGDEALIVKDDQETFRCVWWGKTLGGTDPELGPAGGDLTGEYPNPTVHTVLGGLTPVTTVRPTWHALPYATSWSDYNAPTWTAGQYCIDQSGWVRVRGLVAKSAAYSLNDPIATLPAGFRPAGNELFTMQGYDGSMGPMTVRVDALATGVLNVSGSVPQYVPAGGMSYLSLSGITFQQAN